MEWHADVDIVTDLYPSQVDDIVAALESDVVAHHDPGRQLLRLDHRLRAAHHGTAIAEAGNWVTGEVLPIIRRQGRTGPVLRLTVAARSEH
ncbi:hypothetical protein [Paractinoplanes maris]|uniref:hypothetical protein n=1 Tax=Paractinoplanes maris TaxID=1734446 RepID=UPI002020D813|nr:hypothetical protein [Actinoplanes maris]